MPVEKLKLPDGRTINTSERFEQGRNFANKFWNVARLALMNLKDSTPASPPRPTVGGIEDFWILRRLAMTARDATDDLESFRFGELARRLRDFIWSDFCDWYVEFIKARLRHPLRGSRRRPARRWSFVLDGLCRLLHPIMPFVTEQVWQALNQVAPGAATRPQSDRRPSPASASPPGRAYPANSIEFPVEATIAQWQEKITACASCEPSGTSRRRRRSVRSSWPGRGRRAAPRQGGPHPRPCRGRVGADRRVGRASGRSRRRRAGRRRGHPAARGPDRQAGRAVPSCSKSLADLDRQIAPLGPSSATRRSSAGPRPKWSTRSGPSWPSWRPSRPRSPP